MPKVEGFFLHRPFSWFPVESCKITIIHKNTTVMFFFENFIIEYVSYSTLQLCVEISCYEINMLKMDKVNIKFTNLHI